MGMEEALVARLAPALAGWGERPRSGTTSIELTYVAPGREWTHSGPTNLDRARVQMDCWAPTSTEALALARTTLATMEAEQDVSGWRFHPALVEGRNGPAIDDLDGGAKIWRVMLDLSFYHEPQGAGA